MAQLDLDALKEAIVFAEKNLSGPCRRLFMAHVVEAMGAGGQRLAEEKLGWNRETIRKGTSELHSGKIDIDHRRFNGPKPSIDARLPQLRQDIKELVEPHIQQDPSFTSTRLYCTTSVADVVRMLIDVKGYRDEELPSNESIRRILNDMDYTLRKVRKCVPKKRAPKRT